MTDRVIFPARWDSQSVRKTAFANVFLALAEQQGYSIGDSLKVQGAYAYEMHKDGRTRKIGMKSAYDRSLNTALKMVEKADEVWIMTLRWTDRAGNKVPTHLEVYSVDSKALRAMYDKVHLERAKAGKQDSMSYIPLDAERLEDPKYAQYEVVAGNVLKIAKLLFQAPLHFSDRGTARIESSDTIDKPAPAQGEPVQSLAEQVSQYKEALAKLYGTTPDKVRIIVEA